MAEHSPEPWASVIEFDRVAIRDQDGRKIVGEMYGRDEDEANARRAVACVNACRGIPTESLEGGIVPGEILALIAKWSEPTAPLTPGPPRS